MKTFKIQDKIVEVPTEWGEVSVNHFISPDFLSGNAIGMLAALSGVPAPLLAKAEEDVSEHFKETTAFMELNPQGWRTGATRSSITLLGKTCVVPKDLELKKFGQKVMMGQILSQTQFAYTAIPDALAIYLGDQVYDDWYERMDELKEAILKLPIVDVWPIASFFLAIFNEYRRSGKKDSKPSQSRTQSSSPTGSLQEEKD